MGVTCIRPRAYHLRYGENDCAVLQFFPSSEVGCWVVSLILPAGSGSEGSVAYAGVTGVVSDPVQWFCSTPVRDVAHTLAPLLGGKSGGIVRILSKFVKSLTNPNSIA